MCWLCDIYVYLCMHICIHIHRETCMVRYMCIYIQNTHITDIHIWMYIFNYVYRQTYISLYVYACKHIWLCIYAYMYVCSQTCTYVCMCIHTYYIYTCIHTYVWMHITIHKNTDIEIKVYIHIYFCNMCLCIYIHTCQYMSTYMNLYIYV